MAAYVTKQETKKAIIDREFDRLYKKHKTLTTDILIETARTETHPLHAFFEWNDDVAAEKYRRGQAYAMIQASKYVFVLDRAKDDGPPIIAHAQQAQVRRLLPTFTGEGFKMRNEVLSEEETRAAFLEQRKEALRAWCRSVVDVTEFDHLRAIILGEVGNKS